jgi:hypothetical protein
VLPRLPPHLPGQLLHLPVTGMFSAQIEQACSQLLAVFLHSFDLSGGSSHTLL